MPNVNLDAIIPREDFAISEEESKPSVFSQTLQIRDLEKDAFFYSALRKPDFQRETTEWNADKIFEFIKSFLEGDLIPAVILWNSGSFNFVIDGAHRLSALMAWVNDDYGDGITSQSFFNHKISNDQIKAAEATRKIVKRKIGSYNDHKEALRNRESPKEIRDRASSLASAAIQLQWVKGDSEKAEQSFFKINQKATPINKTELQLLKSRRQPNSLAARAIIRAGTGHKYWSNFSEETQDQIVSIAHEVHVMLFSPNLETPIKTLDLPIGGKGYSAATMSLVLDLINISTNTKSDQELEDDLDGTTTVHFLKKTKKIMQRISGNSPGSLGLHPAVYFYSLGGRYQQTNFLALADLIKDLDSEKRFNQFTELRADFEHFLISYKALTNQITVKYGSGMKGYRRMKEFFSFVISNFSQGKEMSQVIKSLSLSDNFSFLNPSEAEFRFQQRKDFTTETKSAVFLRDALESPVKCRICQGLIHKNAISIDHIVRKQDGGKGALDNAQLTHPYCNTTFKN